MTENLIALAYRLRKKILKPCKDRIYQVNDETNEIEYTKCGKVFHYVIELLVACIPKSYWWLDLSKLKVKSKYLNFVKWYLKHLDNAFEKGLGILFIGANGVGKTSLMCEIGKHAIQNGYKVKYVTAQTYIQATKSDNFKLLDSLLSSDMILLDELDKVYIKRGSNYVIKSLEDFLRKTTSDNKIVIGCTNLDSELFCEIFGESLCSMLKRKLKFLAIEGSDYSDVLQDSWDSKLETENDYFDDILVKAADKMVEAQKRRVFDEWKKFIDRQDN